jgi:virulence-associated protein VagC
MPGKKRGARPYKAPSSEPGMVMETRVFKSGNSYAVRIPKPLYASGEASVYIKKLPGGELLVSPKSKAAWPTGFFASFGSLPVDFEAPERPAADAARDARDAALFGDSE